MNKWTPLLRSYKRRMNLTFNELSRIWRGRHYKIHQLIQDRYLIKSCLGMGSYGVAYLCQDTRLNERCVLKRVAPLRGDRSRAELVFEREVRILSTLCHPAIPKVLNQFHYRGELVFIMEYAQGISLGELLFDRDRVFSEAEALELVRQLLDIVQYLHSRNILHRDISIANLMLDEQGILRLIDFGLAHDLTDDTESRKDALDVEEDDPDVKKLRRQQNVTSDFYAIGHLLLFLLYSGYEEPAAPEDHGWEQELQLHSDTQKLLRRLLLAEQPFSQAQQVMDAVDQVLLQLRSSSN